MNGYPVTDKTVNYTSNGRVSGTHRPDKKMMNKRSEFQ